MIYKLLALVLIAFGASTPALAQQEDAGGFCATAPQEMLAALDGQWSATQGAGFAVAGPMAMPLPPHGAETITLKYDPEMGVSTFSGKDDQILMIAGSSEALAEVSEYLDKEEAEGLFSRGTGCDWYALPIMIGANIYELKESDVAVRHLNIPGLGTICIMADGSVMRPRTDEISCAQSARYERVADGEMSMTVIIKFQSLNSGTGVTLFSGESDGVSFFARAPITLTR